MQLSMVLQAVVSQQLIPSEQGDMIPAFEIMLANAAVRNLIRDGRTHQIPAVISSSGEEGMIGMDASLLKLYETGTISFQNMIKYALQPDALEKLAVSRHNNKDDIADRL